MDLYIVDFHYRDDIEGDISDRWTLACREVSELEDIMKRNFEELERYGFEAISYSFQRVNRTNNGFEISFN